MRMRKEYFLKRKSATQRGVIIASCVLVFSFLSVGRADAAEFFFKPHTAVVGVGEQFVSEVWVHSEGDRINALETKIHFPKDTLRVVSVEEGGSLISLWAKHPSFSNETGEITFAGGIPGGFTGEGYFLRIVFRGDHATDANIGFAEKETQALLHDDLGTLVPVKLRNALYRVRENHSRIAISSPTHEDGRWSQQNHIVLLWPVESDAEYTYFFTNDPLAALDDVPETSGIGQLEFSGLPDGTYYFRIKKRGKGEAEWRGSSVFLARIDRTPPDAVEAKISEHPLISEKQRFISFAATDAASGIDHYEICTQNQAARTCISASNPYPLEHQALRGQQKIIVRAVDKAGNNREMLASLALPIAQPMPWRELLAAILAAMLLFTGFMIARRYFYRKTP